MPIGIPGATLHKAARLVGVDEPPVLAPNSELKSIGKRTARVDGKLKVTGAAKYTADINLPGMLFGMMITSPHPSAIIRSIDTSVAEKYPGVKAIHILTKVFGVAQMASEKDDKYPRIRFAGQPIGAIAATSLEGAEEAARLIKIEYDQQPFVTDVEKAMQPGAPVVFEGQAVQAGTAGGGGGPANVKQNGNVRGPSLQGTRVADPAPKDPRATTRSLTTDEINKALKDADVLIESEYRTQVQTHSALETHGVVADFKPDMLTVWASTQGTSSVRDELSAVFEIAKSKVRVITEFMGGGFGAKFGAGNFGVLATYLSKKAQAPVKLMLSRKDEHLSVGNRPNSIQKLRIGAKKDGTLTAIHLVSHGTGGVGTGAGSGGPARDPASSRRCAKLAARLVSRCSERFSDTATPAGCSCPHRCRPRSGSAPARACPPGSQWRRSSAETGSWSRCRRRSCTGCRW
jgi:xanthine dehydrogenase YagR molybdenum-binding subunit